MDGQQLKNIISRDRCLQERFRGIFARDRVPKCLIPGFFIWNNDLYTGTGEHWLAVFVSDAYKVEFFDSFGQPYQFYGWNILGDVKYNKKSLQSPDSDVCGMYCIYFLYFRCRGLSMERIVADFSSNARHNDEYVRQFMNTLK